MKVLVTGGTGNAGQAVVRRLIRNGHDVVALVRPGAAELLAAQLAFVGLELAADRHVAYLEGDLRLPLCGVGPDRLPDGVTHVCHCGANVDWAASAEDLWADNVTGTANLVALARSLNRRSPLRRVVLISSAYVCGRPIGLWRRSWTFSRYEASKYIAEKIPAVASLSTLIARPSTIVGDSQTGETQNFTGLYFPLRLLATRPVGFFPGRPDVRLDFVFSDHLAEMLETMLLQGGEPVTRICGGPHAPSLRALWSSACEALTQLRPESPPVTPGRFVWAGLLELLRSVAVLTRQRAGVRLLEKLLLYKPYLTQQRIFRTDLGHHAISSQAALLTLYNFALRVDFKSARSRLTGHSHG